MRWESSFRMAANLLYIGKNEVTIFWQNVIGEFFWRRYVFLATINYRSKFHVNIMTASRVKTIFVYKWLSGNLEISNTPVRVLRNIWRLGWVGIPNSGQMLPFLTDQEKTNRSVKLLPPPTPPNQIRVNTYFIASKLQLYIPEYIGQK